MRASRLEAVSLSPWRYGDTEVNQQRDVALAGVGEMNRGRKVKTGMREEACEPIRYRRVLVTHLAYASPGEPERIRDLLNETNG